MSQERVAKILGDQIDHMPTSQTRKLARHLIETCRQYRFDPAFVLSMIQVESSWKTQVISPAGAIGLMQLMPATAQIVAHKTGVRYTGPRSLMDPFTNISLGVAYLSLLREKYRGMSPYYHVAAYNMGPAKLDQVRSKKGFKPVSTKIYYEKIRRGVPLMSFYSTKQDLAAKLRSKGRNRV
jgi:soluble lytic murein transglycosylase-like protein